MNIQPDIELSTIHARDAYRVAYMYAWQANSGRPDQDEMARRAAEAAVEELQAKRQSETKPTSH